MGLPNGIIVMWSGAIVNIPTDWHLCDGAAGTINLRSRFIVGAGSKYDPADTGGATTHDHDFTSDGHTHHLSAGNWLVLGADKSDTTDSAVATGTTDAGSSLPPYYALAFIQKV